MASPHSSAANAVSATDQEARIKHLPPEARAAFRRFQTTGNPAELDPVILAILADFMPAKPTVPLAERPGTTRLIEDLGFDSLGLTEMVFFTEDLFGFTISNDEILQVRSLDDLRGFILRKAADRSLR